MTETTTVSTGNVTLNINGSSIEVSKGTTILEAASQNDIRIPTLCYLKKLLPIGSCRVCSVEIEGVDKPVMSCVTPVVEGMNVTTESDALSLFRKQMIQFILVNHPVDCPVCERSGECKLQNRTYEFSVTDQMFFTTEYEKPPVKDWGVIRYDGSLCIMCERCVKICREIQGANALVIDGSGNEAKINTVDGDPLDCDFCGQCVSVCPVGALNSGIVLSARSWEVTRTESVCAHCAVGCSYNVEVKSNRIVRINSNDDIGINNGNLCARGRFGFEAFQSNNRIETPMMREGNTRHIATWDSALNEVVGRLEEIKEKYGPESIAVIASEKITNEDAYMIQKVFRAGFGVNRLETLSNMRVPVLNSGIFDEFGSSTPIAGYDEIWKAGSFISFGCDGANENPVIANMVRVAMRDKGTNLYVINVRDTEFFPAPRMQVQYNYGSESALVAALLRKLVDKCGVADKGGFASSTGSASFVDVIKTSGVSIDDMEELAERIAKDGPPLIFIGKEIHDHPASIDIVKALTNLAGLLGGKALLYREYSNSQGTNDMGLSPVNFPGYIKVDNAQAVSHYSEKWGADIPALSSGGGDIIKDISDGKIKAVVLVGVDPQVHFPDGEAVSRSLSEAPFV
ncbi:NADH-ubiquinone oxidoreductase chain G, partial [hydrothermal vent metagenome]